MIAATVADLLRCPFASRTTRARADAGFTSTAATPGTCPITLPKIAAQDSQVIPVMEIFAVEEAVCDCAWDRGHPKSSSSTGNQHTAKAEDSHQIHRPSSHHKNTFARQLQKHPQHGGTTHIAPHQEHGVTDTIILPSHRQQEEEAQKTRRNTPEQANKQEKHTRRNTQKVAASPQLIKGLRRPDSRYSQLLVQDHWTSRTRQYPE